MPGRFKLTGDYYVSEWGGNNANVATDPTTPYENLNALTVSDSGVIVIGTGVYKGELYSNLSRTYKADGLVILEGNGGFFINTTAGKQQGLFEGFWIKNYSVFPARSSSILDVEGTYQKNNIYEEVDRIDMPSFVDPFCGFLNCVFFQPSRVNAIAFETRCELRNCIVLSNITWTRASNSYGRHTLYGSYLGKGFNVHFSNTFSNLNNWTNNIINGTITREGLSNIYESKLLRDGSPRPDADPSYLDVIEIDATFYSRGNYSTQPGDEKFLDLRQRLVEPDSSLLKMISLGGYVGGVKPGRLISLDDINFQITFSRIDLTNPLSVKVQNGELDGEIRITGKISDTIISSSKITFRTLFEYWKSATAGTTFNNNVPDAVKELGLLLNEIDRPRRLTYWLRVSQDATANQSSSNLIWDNDIGVPGTWYLMEINTPPSLINTGSGIYGNGDPRATGGTELSLNFRTIDLKIILDNDRD